jgi:hypothetical protein
MWTTLLFYGLALAGLFKLLLIVEQNAALRGTEGSPMNWIADKYIHIHKFLILSKFLCEFHSPHPHLER